MLEFGVSTFLNLPYDKAPALPPAATAATGPSGAAVTALPTAAVAVWMATLAPPDNSSPPANAPEEITFWMMTGAARVLKMSQKPIAAAP